LRPTSRIAETAINDSITIAMTITDQRSDARSAVNDS
jgi:hypothetical protein